ncbi:AAA family ATPase [Flagellimonas okinawensis]|uniref:AAA family ATPase n=1 Tax=Flagellimonas okinawensis TaxID=3031324 RepID=A0ABT5XRT0_9FLAO|nr:AAA family ATPase [[Muricauda] okinawensis]MDF0708599.1 AAA family ATPase [[Muricauda] okinawensis]
MKHTNVHNPFFVITGGPCMGKTTLIKELWHRDMAVIPEISHELIKEQQAIGGDAFPWKNKKQYMDIMFRRSVESFNKALNDFKGTGPVFFDRGIMDALCYASLEGIPIDQEMKTIAETTRYNNNVFILPPWQDIYQTDARRKQDWNEAVFTYNKMIQTYRTYQYDLVEVPKVSVQERADFILGYLKDH